MVQIETLSVEHHPTGLGIDAVSPRLSWRFTNPGNAKDWTQKAYQVRLDQGGQSTTHDVSGDDNVLVPWPGKPLASRERVHVDVRAQGADGKWTEWSSLDVEAGLHAREDWTAGMVGPPKQPDGPKRGERVWKEFEWDGKGERVRLYATAFGVYVPYLNGERIHDSVLNPGWTSYKHNHRYQVYDLSPLLKKGRNVLSADLGCGWYMSRLGNPGGKVGKNCLFGDRWGLLAQLEVDGRALVKTDDSWSWAKSEVLFGEIYDGEHVDTNLINLDWWKAPKAEGTVEALAFPKGNLHTSDAPFVRPIQELKVEQVIKTPEGKTVLDFGQNLVGWIKIKTDLKGGELVIRHAEVMEDGELGTRPLRTAKAEARIKLGGPTKGWEPKFTFFGFRYAEISGLDNVNPDDFVAVVVTSEMRRTGHFSCSHDMINQLHKNVLWSIYGNFLSLPTDCPQRDERLGWTGDIQVFANTANYFFDTAGFLDGWLRDVQAETLEYDGVCPEVVPWMYSPYQDEHRKVRPMGIWADCTALTPWDLYSFFGDKEILRRNWTSMTAWLERGVPRGSSGLYSHDAVQFGDWLDPRAPPQYPAHGQTDIHLSCDAFLVYTTQVVAQIARILGDVSAGKWAKEHERLKGAFQEEYITPKGRCMSDTQTALALALKFDLFPKETKHRAVERIDRLVRWDAFRISTGFAGTPLILNALAENDLLPTAYRMLQEGENPSWLYPVSMGATTIWERWDSMLPNGKINPGQMTSFNHYALGSVAHFLHTIIGGLSPSSLPLTDATATPGWKAITIKPQPGGTIRHAKTSFSSPYGLHRSEWAIEAGKLRLEVEVPPNASATVELPGLKEKVGSGVRTYEVDWEEDTRWPPRPVPGPSRIQPKDEFIP